MEDALIDCILPSHISWPHLSPVLTGNPPFTEQCCSLAATGQQAGVEGTGFSARPKTALALTIDKLVERAFQKPAWLTGRAACRLLSGLVLARADA